MPSYLSFLPIGDDSDRRRKNVKQFAVGDIYDPDEARDDMEVPEEVGVDSYVSEELRQKITPEGKPVIGAGGSEVSQKSFCPNDLRVSDAIPFDKETGKFQEKDEEEGGNVLFFRSELIGASHKTAGDSHEATHQDQEAEEFKEEIEERTDGPGLKLTGERDSKLDQITGGQSLDHIHHKGGDKSKYQQRVSEPAVERLTEKLPMEDDFGDKNSEIPARLPPESSPTSPEVDLKLLPFCGILRTLKTSLQPQADVKPHPPEKENQRG